MQGLAREYGVALTTGLSVADVQGWSDALAAVTPADVMAAARTLLTDETSVTGYLTRPAEEVTQ